jgi:hypothetical protein
LTHILRLIIQKNAYDSSFHCQCTVYIVRIEKSTDQVIKPVNLEALTSWAGSVPDDVRKNIRDIAPMLARLGYDPDAYPPNYGEADSFVANNTLLIKHNQQYWLQQASAAQQLTKLQGTGSAEQPVISGGILRNSRTCRGQQDGPSVEPVKPTCSIKLIKLAHQGDVKRHS